MDTQQLILNKVFNKGSTSSGGYTSQDLANARQDGYNSGYAEGVASAYGLAGYFMPSSSGVGATDNICSLAKDKESGTIMLVITRNPSVSSSITLGTTVRYVYQYNDDNTTRTVMSLDKVGLSVGEELTAESGAILTVGSNWSLVGSGTGTTLLPGESIVFSKEV